MFFCGAHFDFFFNQFFLVKGALALLFSLSLIPLFLVLISNFKSRLEWFYFLFIIFLFHPVASTIFVFLLFFQISNITVIRFTIFKLFIFYSCISLFLLYIFYPIFFTSFDLIFGDRSEVINFNNFNAFLEISMSIHSSNVTLFLLIILFKILFVYFIPNNFIKFILFLFCFIYPYLLFLSSYNNVISDFSKIFSLPWQANVNYFNSIYLFLPFVILNRYLKHYRLA